MDSYNMHAIGVPEGVMLLEFEGLNQEEHPPMEEQELQALEGGVNDEELLEVLITNLPLF
jgi:hypothetical protein